MLTADYMVMTISSGGKGDELVARNLPFACQDDGSLFDGNAAEHIAFFALMGNTWRRGKKKKKKKKLKALVKTWP